MLPLRIKNSDGEQFLICPRGVYRPPGPYRSYFNSLQYPALRRFINALPPKELRNLKHYIRAQHRNARPVGEKDIIALIYNAQLRVYYIYEHSLERDAQVLRSAIQASLGRIIEAEQREKKQIEAQHEKRSLLEKGLAYRQAFDKGVQDGALSLLTWLKQINDIVSLQQQVLRIAQSAWATHHEAHDSNSWLNGFSERLAVAQYKELIEALGFDPTALSRQQLVEIYQTCLLVWEDEPSQRMLMQFAKDYTRAQHSLEWTRLGGGAAFEILLTAVLAVFTGGIGAAASLAGKARLLKPLIRLGEQFRDLAKIVKRAKLRRNRNRGPGRPSAKAEPAFDRVEVPRYSEPPSGRAVAGDDGRMASVGVVPDNNIFLNVASGGKRGEIPLTSAQRSDVDNYLANFDLDGVSIRHVDDTNLSTGYLHGDLFSILNIGSDVVPGNVGLGTLTANSRISVRGTLAHEVVGHREAALAGRTQSVHSLEEAQASIRAARFGPDLTSTERSTLLRDGVTRLHNDGIKVRDVKDQLFINER